MDIDKFGPLINKFRSQVVRTAINMVGVSDGEDVAQDAIIRGMNQFSSFDPERGTFTSWMYMHVRWVVWNRTRRKSNKRTPPEVLFSEMSEYAIEGFVSGDSPEADVVGHQDDCQCLRCMQAALLANLCK